MAYDRPSWKEIDKMRDGSARRANKKKNSEEVKEHSTRYDKYKADLNRLFDQGMASDLLKKVAKDRHAPQAAEEPKPKTAGEEKAEGAEATGDAQAAKASGAVRRKGGSGRIPQDTAKATSRFKLIRAVQDAADRSALMAALDELVKDFGLPDDFEVLVRVVEHPDESLVKQAIAKMSNLLATTAKVPRKASLKERLRTIGQTAADPELRTVARELEERL